MALIAAVGSGQDIDGRQAGAQAARLALDQVNGLPVQFGYVLASSQFEVQDVLNGAASLLGNTPIFGHSTPGFIQMSTQVFTRHRQVRVMLLAGKDIQARAEWWPSFSDSGRTTVRKLLAELDPGLKQSDLLLLASDGLQTDGLLLAPMLAEGAFPVVGLMTCGDELDQPSFQLGGASAGVGGLAAAWLSGNFISSAGWAHGWVPVGPNFVITHVRDQRLRTLDDRPASEKFAELLGGPAETWIRPPMNRLVRMYPLGIEAAGTEALDLLSGVRFETDGSLRLTSTPKEGQLAYLMTGSVSGCEQAARTAARMALEGLQGHQPVACWIFADLAWSYLFEAQPEVLARSVLEVVGAVPMIGGYTLGHVCRTAAGTAPGMRQGEILVVLFGAD